MLLPLAHHHGFKCAGSSVVHLLNRNWPGRVLHLEYREPDRRIRCPQVGRYLEGFDYVAVTSHLLTMPAPGERFAHVHFALVRDPVARIVSAYKFVPGARAAGGFEEFLENHRHHACNFHVRQLAAVRPGQGEWDAAPEAVPLGQPGVLIGLVERFADSMFLLERRLAAIGCEFDGSVGGRHNVGGGKGPKIGDAAFEELCEANAEDYELYERVAAAMDRELAAVDPDGSGRAEHLARCIARAEAGVDEGYLGVGPRGWTYVED